DCENLSTKTAITVSPIAGHAETAKSWRNMPGIQSPATAAPRITPFPANRPASLTPLPVSRSTVIRSETTRPLKTSTRYHKTNHAHSAVPAETITTSTDIAARKAEDGSQKRTDY